MTSEALALNVTDVMQQIISTSAMVTEIENWPKSRSIEAGITSTKNRTE